MFAALFGKKKVQPPPPPQIDICMTLKTKETQLEKRVQHLQTLVAASTQAAVAANRAGNRQKALLAIQKRRLYEQQIQTISAMLMRIVQQHMAIESTTIMVDSHNIIRRGNDALKVKQKEISADAVADLNEEMADLMANQREIDDLMREPVDPDLDAELESLELTTIREIPMPALPAVPVGPVKVQAQPVSEMDRELAALAS